MAIICTLHKNTFIIFQHNHHGSCYRGRLHLRESNIRSSHRRVSPRTFMSCDNRKPAGFSISRSSWSSITIVGHYADHFPSLQSCSAIESYQMKGLRQPGKAVVCRRPFICLHSFSLSLSRSKSFSSYGQSGGNIPATQALLSFFESFDMIR